MIEKLFEFCKNNEGIKARFGITSRNGIVRVDLHGELPGLKIADAIELYDLDERIIKQGIESMIKQFSERVVFEIENARIK